VAAEAEAEAERWKLEQEEQRRLAREEALRLEVLYKKPF